MHLPFSMSMFRPQVHKVMMATTRNSIQDIRKTFEEKNKEDTVLVLKQYQKNISGAFPYLANKITDPEILEELDYIQVMYKKPIGAERRILLRNKILRFIENKELSAEECEGLMLLLKDYKAM